MNLPHWPLQKGYRDIKLGLDRVYDLLKRLGDPHKDLPPVIHVAGTNGKGSNIAYLRSIFEDAGYRVHKYISPNLVRFTERIIISNSEITSEYLTKILDECKKAAEIEPKIDVTFFEGITVAAMLAFSRNPADILLLEVGMGGRLDATNVIDDPIVTIITPISNDHQEFLGNSLEKITLEKAGIIKENVPVVIGKQKKEALDILKKIIKEKNCESYILGENWLVKEGDKKLIMDINGYKLSLPLPGLIGHHQLENASTAIAALLAQNSLEVTDLNLKNGLKNVKWPARLEKITSGRLINNYSKSFDIYLDGGHNENSAKAIANWLSSQNIKYIQNKKKPPPTYLICAMLENKNAFRFLKYLSGNIDFVIGMSIEGEKNSKTAEKIAKNAMELGIKAIDSNNFAESLEYVNHIHHGNIDDVNIFKKIRRKFVYNRAPKARILICGSLYFAGKFISENDEK